MPDTNDLANMSPAERLALKNKQATISEQGKSEIKPISAPVTDAEAAASGQAVNPPSVDPTNKPAETAEGKTFNAGQDENANGERDSVEKFEEGKFEVQGQTKITREAGDSNTGKAAPTDVVQQGGGGVVNAATGKP